MTFDQLRFLDAVIQTGSFKSASESLNRTQPAVSQAIKNLENEFNIKFFSREKYRPALTPEGKLFHRRAKEVLMQTERLAALGREMGMGQEAEFSIALDSLCPMSSVLKICQGAMERFSETKIRLLAEYWSGSIERLLDNDADIAIAPLPDEHFKHLETFPLMEVTLVPVASPHLPLAKLGRELTWDEIHDCVHVLVQDSSRRTLNPKLKQMLEESNTWLVGDHSSKKEIIKSGLGWGRLPEHMIQDELKNGELILFNTQISKKEDFLIHLIRRKDKPFGKVAKELWYELIEDAQSRIKNK